MEGSSVRVESPWSARREWETGREGFEGVTLADGEVAAAGVREGLADGLALILGDGVTCRPGRGRPAPASRPARDAEAVGFGDCSGASGSSA